MMALVIYKKLNQEYKVPEGSPLEHQLLLDGFRTDAQIAADKAKADAAAKATKTAAKK